MAEAFRCVGCREFYSGTPALTLDAQGRTFTRNGEDIIRFDQKGGVADYDPVTAKAEGEEFPWPRGLLQKTTIRLCADCTTEHMLEAIHMAVHERAEDGDQDGS